MPRISYRLFDGRGEWSEISNRQSESLILRFFPPKDGYIDIDDAVYRVKSGEAVIPLKSLADKEYSLRLESDSGGFALEKFTKLGNEVSPLPTEDSTLRALLARCCKNEEKISLLEEKLSILLKRTEGHHIFN